MKLIPLIGLLLVLATSCQTAVNPTEEKKDEISKTDELRKKIEKIVSNKKANKKFLSAIKQTRFFDTLRKNVDRIG